MSLIPIFGGRTPNFPQVAAVGSSDTTSNNTSHTLTIPSGTSAGDLLIAFLAFDGTPTFSGLTGFTQLGQANNGDSSATLDIWYKIATGGESNLTVTSSASEIGTIRVLRINQWHGSQAPEKGTAATGSSTTPNPPSLTPSWGSTKALFIAAFACDTDNTVSAYPTNYDDNQYTSNQGGGTGHCTFGIATRKYAATSDDPGTFTMNASDQWVSQTVAVRG